MLRQARIARVVLLLATLVLLVFFARSVAWDETWRAMHRASPWLLVMAAGANLVSLALRGTRWWVFLRAIGERSLRLALRGAFVGSGLNNLLPANAGEAARVMLVARRARLPSAHVTATVALDRFVDVASYVALLVALPIVVALPGPVARWEARAEMAGVALLGAGVLLGWLAARRRVRAAPGNGNLTAPRSRVREFASRFTNSVAELPTAARLTAALGLSMLSWAAQLAAYHLAARGAGLNVPLEASMVAMLAVNLAFVVQITPGNVGVFQVVYALTMAAFAVPRSSAVAAALLIQALQVIPVTTLALALAPDLAFGRRAPAASSA